MAPGVSLDRRKPTCCAAVESFVHARHQDAHKRKVSAARSIINNGWSVREEQRLQSSKRNVKRDQVHDDRFSNIERENMRLLVRMQEIDHRDVDVRRNVSCGAAGKAAARIVLDAHPNGPSRALAKSSSLPAMGRGSNSGAHAREMRRIDDENRRLLKRLQGAKSTVSNQRMEEQHRAQQKIMNLRQEHAPRMPGRQGRLPFSALPVSNIDPDTQRLEDLHHELQRRLEDLEDQDIANGATHCITTRSVHSSSQLDAGANNNASNHEDGLYVDEEDLGGREYIAGQLPEHSRAIVEKLMREHPAPRSPHGGDAEEAADNAKEAAADMLRRATAIEAQEFDKLAGEVDYLSYENVVQRSRANLIAAQAMVRDMRDMN